MPFTPVLAPTQVCITCHPVRCCPLAEIWWVFDKAFNFFKNILIKFYFINFTHYRNYHRCVCNAPHWHRRHAWVICPDVRPYRRLPSQILLTRIWWWIKYKICFPPPARITFVCCLKSECAANFTPRTFLERKNNVEIFSLTNHTNLSLLHAYLVAWKTQNVLLLSTAYNTNLHYTHTHMHNTWTSTNNCY